MKPNNNKNQSGQTWNLGGLLMMSITTPPLMINYDADSSGWSSEDGAAAIPAPWTNPRGLNLKPLYSNPWYPELLTKQILTSLKSRIAHQTAPRKLSKRRMHKKDQHTGKETSAQPCYKSSGYQNIKYYHINGKNVHMHFIKWCSDMNMEIKKDIKDYKWRKSTSGEHI